MTAEQTGYTPESAITATHSTPVDSSLLKRMKGFVRETAERILPTGTIEYPNMLTPQTVFRPDVRVKVSENGQTGMKNVQALVIGTDHSVLLPGVVAKRYLEKELAGLGDDRITVVSINKKEFESMTPEQRATLGIPENVVLDTASPVGFATPAPEGQSGVFYELGGDKPRLSSENSLILLDLLKRLNYDLAQVDQAVGAHQELKDAVAFLREKTSNKKDDVHDNWWALEQWIQGNTVMVNNCGSALRRGPEPPDVSLLLTTAGTTPEFTPIEPRPPNNFTSLAKRLILK